MRSYGEVAFIALGSNLGDPRQNVLQAFGRLAGLSVRPPLCSSLWKTQPVDCPPGSPEFINAVAGIFVRSEETPDSLLVALQTMEQQFGRKPKSVPNEARPLDLDIITFGRETRSTQKLTIPHPRAHLRRFVLQPLSEIAPDLVWPGLSQTVSQLLALLPDDQTIERIK